MISEESCHQNIAVFPVKQLAQNCVVTLSRDLVTTVVMGNPSEVHVEGFQSVLRAFLPPLY
jgi:hypothetical protein